MVTQLKKRWFMISDSFIVLYEQGQLPAVNAYSRFRPLATIGNDVEVFICGKTSGREDKICNIIMNKALDTGLKINEIRMNWKGKK